MIVIIYLQLHDKFTSSSSKDVIEVVQENVYRVHLIMLFQMDLKTKSGLLKTEGKSAIFGAFCDVQESVNGATINALQDLFDGAIEFAPENTPGCSPKSAIQDSYNNAQKVIFEVATKVAFEVALELYFSIHTSTQNDTIKNEIGGDFILQLKAHIKCHFTEHLKIHKKMKKKMHLTCS